ncbi:hypothetical protein Dimus_037361 [Dionaea muscipula]
MGPKLYISTDPVDTRDRPVTGIRLLLEGKINDNFCQLVTRAAAADDHKYFEPIKSVIFSHICTSLVEHNDSCIEDSASIVTKARLEVKVIGMKKVGKGNWILPSCTLLSYIRQEDAEEIEKKVMSAKFDFNDFLKQTRAVARMGSISRVIGMIPGMGKVESYTVVVIPLPELIAPVYYAHLAATQIWSETSSSHGGVTASLT